MITPGGQDGPAPSLSRVNSGVAPGKWTSQRELGKGQKGGTQSLSRANSMGSMSGASAASRGGSANSEKQEGGRSVGLPSLFKRKQKDKDILALYDNGNLRDLMDALLILEKERGLWLKLWLDIDLTFKNSVNYQAFTDFFLFEDNEFTRKVFDIMNSDLSAVVTFREFVEFCKRYLIIDKDALQEFSFRMLMRQSSRFNAHSVIDAVDLKYFIVNRYGAADSKDTQKASLSLLKEMDNNEGLGLTLTQFKKFSKTCHSVEIFSTKFLMHIRNFVLGNDFWVRRSRLLKKSVLTGLSSLTPMKRVNIDTEIYMNILGLPVVDSKGRGIKMADKPLCDESAVYPTPSRDESVGTSNGGDPIVRRPSNRDVEGNTNAMGVLSREGSIAFTISRQPSGVSLMGGGGGGMSRSPSGISRLATHESSDTGRERADRRSFRHHRPSEDEQSVLSRADSSRSVVSNLSMASAKSTTGKSRRLWLVPFDHESQMRTTYEEDFPAIFEKKRNRKLEKRRAKDELNKAAELMSTRTYQLMVSALEDLVSSKKGLLAAFRIWRHAVGMATDVMSSSARPLLRVTSTSCDGNHDTYDDIIVPTNNNAMGGRPISASAEDDNSIYTRILQSTVSINSETPEEAAKAYLKNSNVIYHDHRYTFGNTDRMAGIKGHYFRAVDRGAVI